MKFKGNKIIELIELIVVLTGFLVLFATPIYLLVTTIVLRDILPTYAYIINIVIVISLFGLLIEIVKSVDSHK